MSDFLCDDNGFAKLAIRLRGVIFYGDPHGVWQPLMDEIEDGTHTVFILGDLAEAKQHPHHVEAARDALCQLRARGIHVHFILGNHDTETDAIHALLFEDFRDNLIEEQVLTIGQLQCRIAGLGGVIKGKIWSGDDAPAFSSPADLLARTPRQERFRGGLPRKQQSSIFPSTVKTLAQKKADILLTHEAPSCHKHGFDFIDDLAAQMGVSLIIHGHHHFSYQDRLANGILVRGLGLAEVWKPQLALPSTQQKLLEAGLDSLDRRRGVYQALKDR